MMTTVYVVNYTHSFVSLLKQLHKVTLISHWVDAELK
jgi:hypothetical protein